MRKERSICMHTTRVTVRCKTSYRELELGLVLSHVQTSKFLSQVSCDRKLVCERGFWYHFSGTKNWCQKLAGIEHDRIGFFQSV